VDGGPGRVARGRRPEPAGTDRRDEFLATLAHEFRNLLAPIRNGLQVLRLTGDRGEVIAQTWGVMERQVGRMERLVDDLLDVSCLNAGKFSLRAERLDLASVVRDALETSRPLIDAAGHQTVVSLPPWPLPVDGDPTRLVQVLANLLNNAAKYTPDGGQIWVSAERSGDEAVVRVWDTGAGITADMLPRLFEMFAQADRTPGRSPGGFGIGLALVRRLVEMHGGRVEAQSAGPGHGSEFTVRLPLASGGSGEPTRREGP
jgi:signal transduction histidine kinase